MENASKALIMAGGVLIGILILSLAAYLFVDLGSTSAEITAQNAQKQITEFNSKFTVYENYNDITIYDIVSLAAYAKENNKYYKDVENEKISVKIDNREIQDNDSAANEKLIEQNIHKDNGTLVKFKCEKIDYNSKGKVNLIAFHAL